MSPATRVLAVTVLLLCAAAARAQPPPEAPPEPAAVAPLTEAQAAGALRFVRLQVGAPPAPADAAALPTLLRVAAILEEHDADPEAVVRELRALLGAPAAAPAASDAQTARVVRQAVKQALAGSEPDSHVPDDAIARIVFARSSHPDPNALEHSHMYFGNYGILFEAQIATHIFFFDNLDGLYEIKTGDRRRGMAVSFTPLLRVRNLKDESGPIKTLSWMPKLDIQAVRLRRHGPTSASGLTLHATVGHHSNGQDECTYQPGVLSREDLCPDPESRESLTINYPNGSFSTNYLRLGVLYRRYTLEPARYESRVRRIVGFGVYAETHPPGLAIGGTLPPVLRPLYGRNRLKGVASFETRVGGGSGLFAGSLRLDGFVEYIDKLAPGVAPTSTVIPDAPLNALYRPGDGSSRWSFGVEAAWTPDWLRGWGLEARYFKGQDYYNLLFVRDIDRLQAGVVFDAAEFLPFHKEERP